MLNGSTKVDRIKLGSACTTETCNERNCWDLGQFTSNEEKTSVVKVLGSDYIYSFAVSACFIDKSLLIG